MYRRSIRNRSLPETAVCFLTEPIEWISFAAQHLTSISFSVAQSPAELPVQLPIKYEMTVNAKTAKSLGLDVPLFLQQRADEVIE